MHEKASKTVTPLKIKGRSLDPNTTIIDWYIDKRCNFHCSYCNPAIHDNWSEHNDLETLKSYALKIYNNVNTKNIMFNLVGGEPLNNPNILELLKFLDQLRNREIERKIKIFTVTNFSLSEKRILDLVNYFDSMVASLHFQFIYKAPEKYLKKILAVYDQIQSSNQETYFGIRFMLAPFVIERARAFESLLKNSLEGRDLKIDYRRVKMSRTSDLQRFKLKDNSDPGDTFDFYSKPIVCEMTKCQDLLDLTQPKIHPSLQESELVKLTTEDFK